MDFDVSSAECAEYWASPPLPTLGAPSYFSISPTDAPLPTTDPAPSSGTVGLGSALSLGIGSTLGMSSTASSSLAGRRHPKPMNILFAFDVSGEAAQLGFLRAACKVVKGVLFGSRTADDNSIHSNDVDSTEATSDEHSFEVGGAGPCFPRKSQVAIVTYDTALHFYDISVSFFTPVPSPSPVFPQKQFGYLLMNSSLSC